MKQKTQAIREEIEQRLAAGECATSKELIELKMEYLGKGGKISALSKGMRDVPAEERPRRADSWASCAPGRRSSSTRAKKSSSAANLRQRSRASAST